MKHKIILALCIIAAFASVAGAATKKIKGDEQLANGDYIKLSRQYPIPDKSTGEIKIKEPDAKLLASWWKSFNDPMLVELIEAALKNNRDINIVRSKIVQARAGITQSRSALLPIFDGNGSYNRGRKSMETYPTALGNINNVYSLSLDAKWELDFFGGKQANLKASVATLEAQYAALYNAWVILSAEVALQYISMRRFQGCYDIAEKNYYSRKASYDLVKSRYDAGLVDQLAVNQAEYSMEKVAALLPPLRSAIEECKNGLAVLTGKVPGELEEKLKEYNNVPLVDEDMLYGIPANLIRQRPDIQMAERQVAAAFSRRVSAKADLWPKFYLVGSLGTEAINGGELFKAATQKYGFGPTMTLPIFHWGALQANVTIKTEAERQALLTYEKTVLNAVSEVRSALIDSIEQRKRYKELKIGLKAAFAAQEIANDKYKSGLVDYDTVLLAQEAIMSLSEQNVIASQALAYATIQMFKALGGGWEPIDAELGKHAEKFKKL